MKHKAVVFDLDGVITDTAKYHYLAWARLAEELGITFTEKQNEELRGLSREESLNALLKMGDLQISEAEKHRLAERKNAAYVELISGVKPSDIFPGVMEIIRALKQRGTPLGLASASRNAPFVMDRLELTDEFDAIVDAATVKNSKPHPEVFLRAAEMLGVDPRDCIGIEDAIHGVTAVKAANMYAIAIGQPHLFPHADVVFENPKALAASGLLNKKT